MKQLTNVLLILLTISVSAFGQITSETPRDTVPAPGAVKDSVAAASSADDLLAGLSDSTETQELLPHKMLFTQRAFWGPKGLLRSLKAAPLTPEGRIKELKVRRAMLVTHQVGGFVTLAGFVAQGLLGAKLYKAQGQEYADLKKWHERSATFINITYGTTLALALTTPPPIVGPRRGFTTIKLHKYLAIVHLSGMIATNVLAHMIEKDFTLKPYHRAAAYATFGAYAASIIALKF
ncbi:hypothetical protein [Spirosoma sp.]|uniref:hypothetical protein n=1 Tax=Spirosoma sp. TaxID=1899569 RepID=UPI003B3A1E11